LTALRWLVDPEVVFLLLRTNLPFLLLFLLLYLDLIESLLELGQVIGELKSFWHEFEIGVPKLLL